jgi:hypothetical protein
MQGWFARALIGGEMFTRYERLLIDLLTLLQSVVSVVSVGSLRPKWSTYLHTRWVGKANRRWTENRRRLENKCVECGASTTKTSWHSGACSLAPRSQLLHFAQLYFHNCKASQDHSRRLRDLIAHWEGKYRIVKHENNQLRKQSKTL